MRNTVHAAPARLVRDIGPTLTIYTHTGRDSTTLQSQFGVQLIPATTPTTTATATAAATPVTTSIATVATAESSEATKTSTPTIFTGAGFIDHQVPVEKGLTIQTFNGCLSF